MNPLGRLFILISLSEYYYFLWLVWDFWQFLNTHALTTWCVRWRFRGEEKTKADEKTAWNYKWFNVCHTAHVLCFSMFICHFCHPQQIMKIYCFLLFKFSSLSLYSLSIGPTINVVRFIYKYAMIFLCKEIINSIFLQHHSS